jgi:hypothetical protein
MTDTGHAAGHVDVVDPFELPEWLGAEDVTWQATEPVGSVSRARGQLVSRVRSREAVQLQVLAADQAYPQVVCSDTERRQVHQAWHHGEVALLLVDGRLTLGLPGSSFSADVLCEALARFAKALGAKRAQYSVLLQL